MSILIKNISTLETVSNGRLKDIDIYIEDNVIKEIGKKLSYKADINIDAHDRVVLPGFINTHHHFYQTFTRNLPKAQNAELFEWLKVHYRVWQYLEYEDIYYSGLTAISELMLTGVTTSTDHLYLYNGGAKKGWIEAEIEAAKKLGMRFYPTRGSMSLSKKDGGLPPDSVVQTEDEIMQHSEAIVNKYHDISPFAMTRISLAPCSPFSVTGKLMKETSEYADKHDLLIHTHLAETKDEESFCIEKFGKRPYYYLKDLGWVNDRAWYAHSIHLNDDEINDMAKNGVGVSHCPSSNMRLGSGIARIPEMLEKNMKVSIAVDGSASNDTSDYLGEMRQALLLARVKYGASAMKTSDVFEMATMGGARILHWDKEIGSIEVGKAADITIWNLNDISYIGAQSDPVAALIFAGRKHQVEYSIINGRVVVDKGELVNIQSEELIKKGMELSNELWKRAGV
ncbi:8-oxoguanine deaminase [bacterium]|nr:8-oxoguanine deaminase [bacterium]